MLEPYDPYRVARPAMRRLRIYSLDPSLTNSLATAMINETTVEVPWDAWTEDGAEHDGPVPGPVGEYLEVVDHDPATGCFYEPVDLLHPWILANDGLPPADGNPQFHQQMVYAVAMRTIRHFEHALGRRALWAPRDAGTPEEAFVRRLRIHPHALREANAYYSPARKALLFGYFRAHADSTEHIPGSTVFTCLSHDIVAHETAHALLDGIHRRWTEGTNPDVLAFHEAFADVVALFQHFTYPEVLAHQIRATRGDLSEARELASLAREFGRAIGRSGALRSAIGDAPDPRAIETTLEPHARGAILVAAVFDAFCAIYRQRTADLVRLATRGSGILPEGAIHPDLVDRLAGEAARAARHVLTICIRALDYLPPVDVDFGDFLRALVTADRDVVPDDEHHYRVAFIEAFRQRGLFPRDARSLSEGNLRWPDAGVEVGWADPRVNLGPRLRELLRQWHLTGDREGIFRQAKVAGGQVHEIIDRTRAYKGLVIKGIDFSIDRFEVHSVRPMRRHPPGGQPGLDAVVEITQRRPGYFDRELHQCPVAPSRDEPFDFWFRGGVTLIVDVETGSIRYCISRELDDPERYRRTRDWLAGRAAGASLHATYFGTGADEDGEPFAMLHRDAEARVHGGGAS